MPTFLSEENSPIYSSQADIIDLDLTRQLQISVGKGKINTGIIRPVHSHSINDTYQSSSSSTQDSETSEFASMTVNQNGRPPSTSSLTNGNKNDHKESLDSRPSLNGASFPDRAKKFSKDETIDNASPNEYKDPLRLEATTKSLPNSGRQSPLESVHAESYVPALSAIPSQLEPGQTQENAAPNLDAQPRAGPHRYSSPPVYQPGATIPNSPSTGHLQPPPVGAALRHRHTLEVPKVASSRLSKDGMDSAHSSGRYSPGPRRASMSLIRRGGKSTSTDNPRDEIATDEDTIRWQATVRQKRASKRKRKEEEDDDRVLVGTKVDQSHANWVTAYNMLTGIRVSVSRTNAKLDRELTDADFEAKQKSTFDVAGNELVPSAKYDFKFKDYAPWVFRRLRTLFRLDPADYLMSLTGKYILSELGSPGKSGSFFYFSRDYKYIIKTIHHAEHKFLRKILKDYYKHVTDNPNTLLSQFYGLHRVKTPYGKRIHFVVMNNLFPPHRDIHTTFDLKGSTIGRDYKEEELEKNPRATLKDLNWLRRQRHIEFGIQKKRLFLEQLQKDVVLLKKLQIMDYSLLIGIHDLSRGNEENLRDKTLQVFNPGGEKGEDEEQPSVLMRTPSKMENQRKTRELRQMLRQERPVPLGQASNKIPNELGVGHARPGFVFNQDDGGFRATHEENEPADEIYYLGVIDCLTHYGMIKKIEHFWKGLSSDKTQISALPPQQYGDRFYNFVEGITMSPEAAELEARQKAEEEIRVAAEKEKEKERSSRKVKEIPPMPEHKPPAVPVQSPEGRDTVEMAEKEARKTERNGASEKRVPDRTLRTTINGRDSIGDPVLPIVEEAGEGRSTSSRPGTGDTDKPLPPTRGPPPTPPKCIPLLKPESADSGYAANSTISRDNSMRLKHKPSSEDLDKILPPLPANGGSMAA